MKEFLYKWRYYGLERDEYNKYMEKTLSKNITGLRWVNALVTVLAAGFTIFPVLIEQNYNKAGFYVITAFLAIIQYIFVRIKYSNNKQEKQVESKLFVYVLIILYYTNIIMFGIYLGVWANPGQIAGSFLAILICALVLFNIPAILHFCLTLIAMTLFIIIVIVNKPPAIWTIDLPNTLFAGAISLIISWQIIRSRVLLASVANKLEDERNLYFDQSTIDELTQLKNRRNYMDTFQRYLSSYRQTDKFLCIAMMDIDFFKKYNDHYGHPAGDECLRKLGSVLKNLSQDMKVYSARVGGEEFSLLWFEDQTNNAEKMALQVKQMIDDLKIPHEKSEISPYVTVSIGIYITKCGISQGIDELYNLADKALYNAKKNGRNQIVIDML